MFGKAVERRNKDGVMGLGEHLEELRKRVFLAVIVLAPLFFACLPFGDRLLEIALHPAIKALHKAGEAANFQLNGALEGFSAYVKVALVVTIALGGPWVVYQLWKFVAPGLYNKERRFVYLLAPFSCVMGLAGLAFAYFAVLPVMYGFLIPFNAEMMEPKFNTVPRPPGMMITSVAVLDGDLADPKVGDEWINKPLMLRRVCIGMEKDKPIIASQPLSRSATMTQHYRLRETLDSIVTICLAGMGCFQTPVVILLLGWAGIASPAFLKKNRKYALAGAVILGAILAPAPDAISLLIIIFPLYGLYELGLLLVVFLPASRVLGGAAEPPGGPADGP